MKKFLTLTLTVLIIGIICFTESNVSARGAYYTESISSNVHQYEGAEQYFKSEAQMEQINANTGSLRSISHTWKNKSPIAAGKEYRFDSSAISVEKTTSTYKIYKGTSIIQMNSNANSKVLRSQLNFKF